MTRGREVLTTYDAATAPFEKGTDKIERRLARLERKADRHLGAIDRRIGAAAKSFDRMTRSLRKSTSALRQNAIAIGAATAGLTLLVGKSFEFAESISDQAAKTGVAVEALQELQFAADQNGASARDMTDALTRLQRRLGLFVQNGGGPARAGMEALGLTAEDLKTKFAGTEPAFLEVTRRLAELGSQAEISAVASAFFGDDAGPRLAALLAQGQEGIEKFRREARELGIVMSAELAGQAGAVNAKMRALGYTVRNQVATAVVTLAPQIEDLVKTLTDALPAILAFAKVMIKAVEGIAAVANGAHGAVVSLRQAVAGPSSADGVEGLRADFSRDQLEAERARLARRIRRLQGRIDHADLGGGVELGFGVQHGDPAASLRADLEKALALKAQIEQALAPIDFRGGAQGQYTPGAARIDLTPDLGGGVAPGAAAVAELRRADLYDQRQISLIEEARALIEETRSAEKRLAIERDRLAQLQPLIVDGLIAEARSRGEVLSRADAEVEARARVAAQLEELAGATEDFEAAQRDAFKSTVSGLLDIARTAETAEEAIGQIIARLGEMALQRATDGLLDGLFDVAGGVSQSRGGSSFLSDALKFAGSAFGGFRAAGGPVSRGNAYIVGERGPELFVPPSNGEILPRLPAPAPLPSVGPAAPGGAITLAPTINVNVEGDAGGDDPAETGRTIAAAVKLAVNEQMAEALRPGGMLYNAQRDQ